MNQEQGWAKRRTFRGAVRDAVRGIGEAYRGERNLRIQILLCVVAVVLALVLRVPRDQIALILVVSVVVITVEMINSALEAIENIIDPQYNQAIRRSKDIAAGAILVASIAAGLVGLLVLLPPLVALLVGG